MKQCVAGVGWIGMYPTPGAAAANCCSSPPPWAGRRCSDRRCSGSRRRGAIEAAMYRTLRWGGQQLTGRPLNRLRRTVRTRLRALRRLRVRTQRTYVRAPDDRAVDARRRAGAEMRARTLRCELRADDAGRRRAGRAGDRAGELVRRTLRSALRANGNRSRRRLLERRTVEERAIAVGLRLTSELRAGHEIGRGTAATALRDRHRPRGDGLCGERLRLVDHRAGTERASSRDRAEGRSDGDAVRLEARLAVRGEDRTKRCRMTLDELRSAEHREIAGDVRGADLRGGGAQLVCLLPASDLRTDGGGRLVAATSALTSDLRADGGRREVLLLRLTSDLCADGRRRLIAATLTVDLRADRCRREVLLRLRCGVRTAMRRVE